MKVIVVLQDYEIDFVKSLLVDYSINPKHTEEGIKTSKNVYSKLNSGKKVE